MGEMLIMIQSPPAGLVVDGEDDQSEKETSTQVRLQPYIDRDADETDMSRAQTGARYGRSMLLPLYTVLNQIRKRNPI